MRETFEFRLFERRVAEYLPHLQSRGTLLADGFVRKLLLPAGDPILADIGRVDRQLRASGGALFGGWEVRRRYTARELQMAELFHVEVVRVFEPAGEECGTRYADAGACTECGAGAEQVSPLYLEGRRIPRGVDFATTIAGEVVASRRAMLAFREVPIRGAVFEPIRLADHGGAASSDHFQMRFLKPFVEIDARTVAGADPFDGLSTGRCSCGHVLGLNLLSEVSVRRDSRPNADLAATVQMVGVRRGLLRPRRVLVGTQRLRALIQSHGLRGMRLEVAQLV